MKSLRARITATYALIVGIALVPLGLVLTWQSEHSLLRQSETDLRNANLLVESIVRGLDARSQDKKLTERTLHDIVERGGLHVTLLAEGGGVLFDSFPNDSVERLLIRPEVLYALDYGEAFGTRYNASRGHRMAHFARALSPTQRLSWPSGEISVIRTATVIDDIDAALVDLRWKTAGFVLGVLVLTTLFGAYFSRRITGPIGEMGARLHEIGSGNFDRKLDIHSRDELGALADSINNLAEKLRDDARELDRLQRIRSQFLANVSHEVRTPLFSLKGFLETLLDGGIDDPQVSRRFAEKAYHHASRLDTLLTDLIDISRIESGEMKMSFRYFPPGPYLTKLRDEFTDQALQKRQELLLRVAETIPDVYGDKERLHEALSNIVDNALKYSQQGATIELQALSKDRMVVIAVSDNGPGIAPEHLPRIFERFYRIDQERSRSLGGTGLGLAIAKHIVEAHDSQLQVESEPGRGTRFSFRLRT